MITDDVNRSMVCSTCNGIEQCESGGWISVVTGEEQFLGRPVIRRGRCSKFTAALKQKRIEELIRSSKLPLRLKECTFKTFHTDGAPQNVIFAKQIALAASESNGTIVFSGTTGVGKTHLAAAIVNSALFNGKSAVFVPYVSLLNDLKSSFCSFSLGRNTAEIYETLRSVDCLALDDVGQEKTSDYSCECLFEIVNDRYNSGKQLILTTNCLNYETLAAKMSAWGPYIVRRLKDMGRWVQIEAAEYRGNMK